MSKKILLAVTGSIASYKACDLISILRKKGYSVQCVMSSQAEWFVTPLTLETLSGEKVLKDMFGLPQERIPGHISAADSANMILIAPASADCIAKIAAGICDDMLTAVVCATNAPVLIAPAMNDKMYTNPIIQEKIAYLKDKGYHFVGPVEGHLACDRTSVGHIAPLDEIVEKTEKLIKN